MYALEREQGDAQCDGEEEELILPRCTHTHMQESKAGGKERGRRKREGRVEEIFFHPLPPYVCTHARESEWEEIEGDRQDRETQRWREGER